MNVPDHATIRARVGDDSTRGCVGDVAASWPVTVDSNRAVFADRG